MQFHIDPAVEHALIQLNDELCNFERNTGRQCTLILVPHTPDEEIHLSQSGKPLPDNLKESIDLALERAFTERGESAPH